jgi:hypothetical protein
MYLPKIPLRFPKASAPQTDHTGFEFGHMPMDNSIIESFNGKPHNANGLNPHWFLALTTHG